jgi:serine/threonine protein kinase
LETPLICPKCLQRLPNAPNFCPGCGEDLRGMTPTADTLAGPWVGRVIDGRYVLKEKLGEGGMGAVFKVEHVRMGKVLALKLLRPDVATDKKIRQRFQQEARVVSKLSHPNTIQVFDFGELDDGSLYIAMEYLPGRDLAWLLRAHGAFSEEKALSIGIQVLASLSEAHEVGIVHRDVKPANVMMLHQRDRDDWVKVLDFGIAKLNEGEGRKHITGVADFIGTPAYMSPEQALGDNLDARSDLYSLGAMLFELVSGRPVFEGPTPMSIVTKHMSEPTPRLIEVAPDRPVSPALEGVIRKALAKDRKDRFASADQMRAALEKVRRDLGLRSNDFTPLPDVNPALVASRQDFDRFERSLRFRRGLAPAVTVALLVALGLGGWQAYRWSSREVTLAREVEPNDDPEHANPIALDVPVRGKIGAPRSETESDLDVYVVDVPEPGILTLELSGVQDMNLVLEAFQGQPGAASGTLKLSPLLVLDDAPTGEGERIDALGVQKGPLFVRVSERHFFTEPVRPPRETTKNEYQLTVRRTRAPGQTEIEPNDVLSGVKELGAGKAIYGFTGAWVPYERVYANQSPSTADFLVADQDADDTHAHAVLIVPPEEGGLLVTDAADFEAWRKADAEGNTTPLPPPRMIQGRAVAFPLNRGRHGVRVQPAAGTPPGAMYAVAFVTPKPDGLMGALDLSRTLASAGRAKASMEVLEAAKGMYPDSPQIPELRSLMDTVRVAQEPPSEKR